MKNYVTCNRCSNWSAEVKMSADCPSCKNKRLIPDPKDILCNNCGNTLCPIGTINEQVPHGLVNARVVGGYDSYHLFDTTSYTFSMCELCLRNLFINFKIKPVVSETDLDESDRKLSTWEQDLLWYESRIWEDNGGPELAYKKGKCNFKKDCEEDAVYSQYLDDEFTIRCCCEEHKDLHSSYSSTLKPFVPAHLKVFI